MILSKYLHYITLFFASFYVYNIETNRLTLVNWSQVNSQCLQMEVMVPHHFLEQLTFHIYFPYTDYHTRLYHTPAEVQYL